MKKISLTIFQLLAGMVAVYHGVFGFMGILLPRDSLLTFSAKVFGLNPRGTTEIFILAKMIFLYMVVLGLIAGFIMVNPLKYRHLIWVIITFFAGDAVFRVVYNDIFLKDFHSTFLRSMLCVSFMVFFSIGLIVFKPKHPN